MSDSSLLSLQLTPHGALRISPSQDDASALSTGLSERLAKAFSLGAGRGLLHLGAVEIGSYLPPTWAWWRALGSRYVTALRATPEGAEIDVAVPSADEFERLIADSPPMQGGEYLSADVLARLWAEIDTALRAALAEASLPLQAFLQSCHPSWHQMGRVHFNLAENRKDPDAPFAFMATFTTSVSAHGKVQHQPLSLAIQTFSGTRGHAQLLALLQPVQRASEHCSWLREMVANEEIYHPLRWTASDAMQLLRDIAALEAAGIVVRMPGTWGGARPLRPKVRASVGTRPPSMLGMASLLDFQMEVSLDGETLSASEIAALLQAGAGLRMLRGHWVEVDPDSLARLMARFQDIERRAANGELELTEGMRLLAGVSLEENEGAADNPWAELTAGPWLAETLAALRQPEGDKTLAPVSPGDALHAKLRPYQLAGVRWMYLLTRLKLGACLADDMGLGKTIQILSLLLILKREAPTGGAGASVVVAPASLLSNWAAEAARFAPSLRVLVAHPGFMPKSELKAIDAAALSNVDLVITSYGTLTRLPALSGATWRVVIVDEAQAIKNPSAQQTKKIKLMQADSRIALTGTPVENGLTDLWSIFDFTHPGLLGSQKTFANFTKRLADGAHFGPLRALVQPYILRRMKTDKRVIADLPDKTELKAWCPLSQAQITLYEQAVDALATALNEATGIARKGLILATLMRFKQICNHPSQWTGDDAWREADSGKFHRLREIVETIKAKQEKVLLFTQFRETTAPLAAYLASIFGREGLVLHGGTPVAKRRELVKRFQEDEAVPFFVLSLKAGGSGLNLTAASHVIHFDRWWNPAVEAQATDRAFRIGQKRNVLVHKFICRGTVEEKIDALIESKQQLVKDVLEGGAEKLITEMSDADLLNLVKLDINSADQS